jgi:FkbM family methyltransferase
LQRRHAALFIGGPRLTHYQGGMASLADVLRQVVREGLAYVQSAFRVRTARIDGFEILVDYQHWSAKLVRRVLAGRYEVEERRLVRTLLSPGDRVLEIGGGVGLIAMLCARIVGPEHVFVYEANPRVLAVAERNLRRNGLGVSLAHAAVVGPAHAAPEVTFFVSRDFWSSSLLQGPKADREETTAPALKLDELIARHRPSVIIADVEGAEFELFLEADLSNVQKLCIEFHTRYIGVRKVSDLIASLLGRGFLLQLACSEREVLYFSRSDA